MHAPLDNSAIHSASLDADAAFARSGEADSIDRLDNASRVIAAPDTDPWTAAESWFTPDTQAFVVSLLFHVVLILSLAIVPFIATPTQTALLIDVAPSIPEEDFTLIEDVAVSEEPSVEIGANSNALNSSMALSMAPVLADLSELPSPSFHDPVPNATFELNNRIEQAVGLVRSDVVVKGMTGVGTNGTDGAVDRITYEILRAMEERPTLVVWFFDQSGSLQKRREEIRNRFDRIYAELGIVAKSNAAEAETDTEKKRLGDEPLLTGIFTFGQSVNLLTPKPTAELSEIRQAIDSIDMDTSGVERVFSAVYKGIEKFKAYRSSRSGRGPERNVLFIVVTDERGDDIGGLEATIKECTKYAIPVYVIGVPAPFGRDATFVKYVDPDPNYDQTPQWAPVDQGPESIMPERIRLGYRDQEYDEPVIDSGFGPFALSRLAYETGGIYFTVHPNRNVGARVSRNEIEPFAAELQYFFDPEVMAKYRPDYVSIEDYKKRIASSPLRQVIINAAQIPRIETLINPQRRFVKRDEPSFVNDLTAAQRAAARVEPQLQQMAALLAPGEQHVAGEISPRWIAAYQLAYGTVLYHKVRAEAYNLMLAEAKRGLKFSDDKFNTWVLQPSQEVSVGSRLEKEAEKARQLLEQVASDHRGTPWGLLAQKELDTPNGWKWTETYTDLNPPANNRPGNPNPNPPPPQDDQARMLAPPPPTRPVPKL